MDREERPERGADDAGAGGEIEHRDRFAPPEESASIQRSDGGSDADEGTPLGRMLRQAAPFIGAAWAVTAGLVLGALGGRWLDARFGTAPWFLLAGIVLGLAAGFYELARVALRAPGARDRDR
jgi:hypothetical protein